MKFSRILTPRKVPQTFILIYSAFLGDWPRVETALVILFVGSERDERQRACLSFRVCSGISTAGLVPKRGRISWAASGRHDDVWQRVPHFPLRPCIIISHLNWDTCIHVKPGFQNKRFSGWLQKPGRETEAEGIKDWTLQPSGDCSWQGVKIQEPPPLDYSKKGTAQASQKFFGNCTERMKHLQCHKQNPKTWSLHKSTCRINAIYYWNLSLWNTSFGSYFIFRCKTGYCMWLGRNVALCISCLSWLFNRHNLDSITSTTTCICHKQLFSRSGCFCTEVCHG